MLKRFLFILLLLGFVISVPYEVSAAPEKETRKERRERLKREREEKRKQRQQKNTQQSKHPQEKKQFSKQDTSPAKQPQPKKITPTFEEKLTPAQVDRKIQTIRKRIETAPENVISSRDKPVLLEAFDDVVQTPMGRFSLEKAHPNLNFRVKEMSSAASYGYGSQCVSISKRDFEEIRKAKTPAERAKWMIRLSGTLIHETTHSIQHINNMNNRDNMSFKEKITINKLFELHSALHEEVSRYQMANLPKYRPMAQQGKIEFTPLHRFYGELFDAYKATGMTEERAHRSARTKFVETCWRNNPNTPIQIGDRTIRPTTSNANVSIESWNISYNFSAFSRTVRRDIPSHEAMRDRGIERQVRRFIRVMDVDTPPSLFSDSKTSAFNMPSSRRLVGYLDGIRNRELDAIATGVFSKGYENGTLSYINIETNRKQVSTDTRNYTEYYEGTRIKKSTYTYRDGKMNGVYREYDRSGQQILEIPVENDQPHGEGWSLENGKRVVKKFRHGYWYNRK